MQHWKTETTFNTASTNCFTAFTIIKWTHDMTFSEISLSTQILNIHSYDYIKNITHAFAWAQL